MALILLILQIASAIPTILDVIERIMKIIGTLKGADKRAAEKDLRVILTSHKEKQCGDKVGCHSDLERYYDYLSKKYAGV